ncbi:MAG: signal peptidase II [Erysipelotrichaceae bacterium]|nr:signal peptidase II [Erysipelotrichaceae bacterium]MBR3167248.1 signal peptidase II [Erysipelotrichaceae bacterium]
MKHIKAVLIVLFGILLDQITKYYVAHNFIQGARQKVIDGFFYLTYVRNTGAGFSILQGQRWVFIILTFIALPLFIYLYVKSDPGHKLERFAYLLLISGTIGNFIDRVLYGSVVDFLDFIIFGYDFPVFNVADIFITVGVGLYLLLTLLETKHA